MRFLGSPAMVVAAIVAAVPDAAAQEPDAGEPAPVAAADVAAEPRPHEVSGLATPDPSRDGSTARAVARGLLALPRWAFEAAMQPIRGSLWLYERYQLGERFKRVFFNETETYGAFPSLFFETGFGFNFGARLVHRDLFGRGESMHARLGWGGRYVQRYLLAADTGHRFDRLRVGLNGEIEVRDRERFAGIGDRDLASPGDVALPLDPVGDGPAVESRYRQRFSRVWASAEVRLVGPLSATVTGGVSDRKLSDQHVDDRGDLVISDAYDVAALPGFDAAPTLGYGELELAYTTRRPLTRYVTPAWWSTGWHATAFGGYANGLGKDTTAFFRYGVDLQRYLDLYRGSRVLVLRLYGEGVSEDPGPRVPFTELPSLGGNYLLRGYHHARFRDRYIAMGSAEYQFGVNSGSYGYVFVDAGKAMRTLDADAFDDPRISFGGGYQINTKHSFVSRLLIAGSRDGDFLLSLTFEPQFDLESRIDRR